jgi:hypothetical protein
MHAHRQLSDPVASPWRPALARITSRARLSNSATPFLKGHKNDYRDAEAIAEAVQWPT